MTREEAIQKASDYLASLRTAETTKLARREDEIRAGYPEIKQLLTRRVSLPLESLRLAMSRRDNAASIAERMKNEGLRLNQAIRDELVKAGYPADYLNTRYECAVCRDTGYLEGVPAEMCDCMKRRISEYLREGDGVSDFGKQNFAAFNPERIPEFELAKGLTQRAFTIRVKEICEEYADTFPNTLKLNMVLSGPAGVGKTFLLNCIAERVESKGTSATIITAYRLLEAMRAKHLRDDEGGAEYDRLLTCPLLLIDDLGSEPVLRNISREYLGFLINERMLRKLHTVISCNLTKAQICEIYDERIMSRLADRATCDFISIDGKDIRQYVPGSNK